MLVEYMIVTNISDCSVPYFAVLIGLGILIHLH